MSSAKFIKKVKSMAKVTASSSLIFGGMLYYQNDEKFFQNFLMPFARLLLEAETAHKAALKACQWRLVPRSKYEDPETLVSCSNC